MIQRDYTERAKTFAASWYARPASGCDEATLADLLAWAMREVAKEAERKTREQIASRLAELTR